MKTNNPEILKAIASRDQRIVELAQSDPALTYAQIAGIVRCHVTTVGVIFQRNGITRKLGRPRKAVSRG